MPSDLDTIRARHVPTETRKPDVFWCDTCRDVMPCDTVLVLAALDMLVPITADRERERDAAIERERLARLAFEEARLPDPRLDALLAAVRDVLDGGGVVRSTALRDALAAFEETP